MFYVFVTLVLLAVIGLLTVQLVDEHKQENTHMMGCISIICSIIGLIIWSMCGFSYYGAGVRADVVNKQFETNYTRVEMFYADDIIDVIQEIKRKRVEVNGDLFTGE